MLRAATWPISRRKVRTQRPSTHHSLVCTVSAPNPLAGDAAEAAPRMIRPASALRALVPLTDSNLRRQAKAGSTLPLISRNSALLGRGRPYYQMDTCGKDEITTLTTRACHSSAETRELANKSCVPCNSKDLHPMSEDSARKLLEQVNSWELTTEGGILKLHRAWKVKNFVKGLEFFQLVAAIAEEEGHHPDLHLVGWNNVKVDIWTHSVRGLTENDFVLAAKINRLNLEGLVSKKKAKVQE